MDIEFPLSSDAVIPEDHLVHVCRYRQGSSCCKYVVFFEKPNNFYCVKKDAELNEKISSLELKAKGDNCEGLPK